MSYLFSGFRYTLTGIVALLLVLNDGACGLHGWTQIRQAERTDTSDV
jgi:hypothetical protein